MRSPNYSRIPAALAAVLLAGCAAPLRLPDGRYTNAEGGGTLIVSGDRIEFRIPTKGASTPFESGSYGYHLDRDGGVTLYGSSNSSYFLLVVLEYQWRWTGTAFESTDRDDGTIVTFTPVR